jgi:hypothetical protein
MAKRDWRWRNLSLDNRMQQKEYLTAIAKVGVSRLGAGKTFGLSGRQAQRIASGRTKVTGPLGKLIRLALQYEISAEELQAL